MHIVRHFDDRALLSLQHDDVVVVVENSTMMKGEEDQSVVVVDAVGERRSTSWTETRE